MASCTAAKGGENDDVEDDEDDDGGDNGKGKRAGGLLGAGVHKGNAEVDEHAGINAADTADEVDAAAFAKGRGAAKVLFVFPECCPALE